MLGRRREWLSFYIGAHGVMNGWLAGQINYSCSRCFASSVLRQVRFILNLAPIQRLFSYAHRR
jgi:hypothetical protein